MLALERPLLEHDLGRAAPQRPQPQKRNISWPAARPQERRFSILRIKVAPDSGRYWDWTPLRMIDAGKGKASLITSHGTYVSAHLDGSLSADSKSVGQDETFDEIVWENNTCALKSSFGKFLQAEADGTMTADGERIGSNNVFTLAHAGGDVLVESNGQVLAAVGYKLSLLTTAFLSVNPHTQEQFAALVVNLMNEVIYDVHILTESDCGLILKQVDYWISRMPNKTISRKAMYHKFTCVPSTTGVQPLYKDFFEYANTTLAGNLVLFANGDIAFDETLRRINPDALMTAKMGMILSVQPPPQNSFYKDAFGFECSNTPRCAVGAWKGGCSASAGVSWDAYIFASPLSSSFNLWGVDVIMNIYGGEQVAAFQLEAAGGLTLYNPCYHVHAFHWHCQGGKTHSLDHSVRVDKPPHRAAKSIYPCWHCPGVTMPRGSAKASDLCRSGYRQWVPSSKAYFHQPQITVNVCCSSPGACGSSPVQWLDACVGPDDLDCVIWEFVGGHVWY